MTGHNNIKIVFVILISLIHSFLTFGQEKGDLYFSGSYNNIPFEDFVKDVENKTALRFYYPHEKTNDIRISASGNNISLVEILKNQLKEKGLQVYIDDKSVYIFPGEQITSELPVFKISSVEVFDSSNIKEVTNDESKYLSTKMISSVQVLEVGNKGKTNGGSRCIVSGKIVDEADSEPLIGATVYIEELGSGAVTDLDGKFKLILKPGKYKAVFNYLSMKQQEYYLQVYSGGDVTIEMRKELIALDEVMISANRYDNVKGIQMGFEKISAKAIKEIPVAFGERDVLKVAQMMPGVLNVGEGASGFNVRGNSEDQNMFYINKIPVYNTSHLFGFFTSFNPDIINDFTLYKSNIPAMYGGRLSSVFNITTRPGSKKKFYGQGGISPITAHTSLEIPVIKDKVSVVTSFRRSYSDWLLKKIKDNDIKKSSAYFYDGSFSINAELNNKNQIKAFTYQSRDEFALSSINEYDYTNTGASLDWKHVFNSAFSSNTTVIYSSYSFENIDKTNLSKAYLQKYKIENYEVRTDFALISKANHKIEFGADAIYYNLDRGKILPNGENSNVTAVNFGKETGLEYALYISDEFALLKRLTVSGGIRYSFFNLYGPSEINYYAPEYNRVIDNLIESKTFNKGELIKSYSGPEYRFSFNQSLGVNSSLKASYNRLYQYIFMLRNSIAVSPNDKWKLCDYHIKPPVSDQLSIGYYRNFNKGGINANIELYRKWIDNQVEYKDGTDFTSTAPIETMVLQGKQKVYGVEFMVRKNSGKTTGWISYSFSRSFTRIKDSIPENNINYGIEYPSNYDRPHSVNMVLNHKINRRLSFSANFVYTTGRPVTLPVSIYYAEGQQLLDFSKRNEFRIPDYIRLDLSVNLEGNLYKKKPLHSSWSINVYNAFGRDNAYSVFYDVNNGRINGHKLSIFAIPIFTIAWNYKFGNYLND